MQKSNEQRLIELNMGLDNIKTDLAEIKATIRQMCAKKDSGCPQGSDDDEGSKLVPLSLREGK